MILGGASSFCSNGNVGFLIIFSSQIPPPEITLADSPLPGPPFYCLHFSTRGVKGPQNMHIWKGQKVTVIDRESKLAKETGPNWRAWRKRCRQRPGRGGEGEEEMRGLRGVRLTGRVLREVAPLLSPAPNFWVQTERRPFVGAGAPGGGGRRGRGCCREEGEGTGRRWRRGWV